MSDRTTTLGRYTFDEVKHLHKLDDKALTGVTTILGIINKPALIQWSANMTVEYLKEHGQKVAWRENELIVTLEQLDLAKKAYAQKRDKAGDAGTAIHDEVEKLIKEAMTSNNGKIKREFHSDNPQIQHFIDWAVNNDVKFLESEVNVYSEDMWIGGICDIVCEIEDNVWIGDIKTSTGIYEEAFFQCAGYDMCLKEMKKYEDVRGYLILNLRKDGGFEEKRSISNEDNQLAFKSALNLYRIKEKIKNVIK